ncbi:MAG: IgGFc-binding protein [Bacteroidetes bacterium]|nr:IgGFc-binding protein [Bacteroidota bacterium]
MNKRKLCLLIFGIVFLSCAISQLKAQGGISSDGREYFLGFVTPSIMRQQGVQVSFTPQITVAVLITSGVDNSVDVSYFDESGNAVNGSTLTIKAGTTTSYSPDLSAIGNSYVNGEAVHYGTLHIVSRAPITVSMLSTGACTGGSYLALPVSCWGKRYVVQSYLDNPNGSGGMINQFASRGFFQVSAAENGTEVTITPSTTTAGGHPGAISGTGGNGKPQPFTVTLNRGQFYTVYSGGADPSFDLTGTLLTANKPIGVLSGHENAFPTDGADELTFDDARDYVIEQIIPVEAWDSTGYVTLPFYEGSASGDPGTGDEIRIVGLPGNGNSVLIQNGSSSTAQPTPSYSSVNLPSTTVALGLKDVNGKPFGVMQYDQSMQAVRPPNPAPSMLSIIPRSRWKSEYYFSNPSSKNNTRSMYLLITAPRSDWNGQKILVSHAGAPASSLTSAGFGVKRTWNTIPGDSALVGVLLVVNGSGTFRLTDVAPAADPSRHSTFGAAIQSPVVEGNAWPGAQPIYPDVPFEFANPLGMQYGQFGVSGSKLGATITNNCGVWDICVHGTGSTNSGIRYIELVNYPDNTYTSPLPISRNVQIDPTRDPLGKGEILLPGSDAEYCFSVSIVNPADSATAVVRVYDNSGASKTFTLSATTAVSASATGSLAQLSAQSFTFGAHSIDSEVCGIVKVSNATTTAGVSVRIDSLRIVGALGRFTVNGSVGTFPISLPTGGALNIPVCYHALDTVTSTATLRVYSDCGRSFDYVLRGKGLSPILKASDITFDATDSGHVSCDTVLLRNVGTLPLVVSSAAVTGDTANFHLAASSEAAFPLTIPPGAAVSATLCYSPYDRNAHSAIVHWVTNMASTTELQSLSKSTTSLLAPGFGGSCRFSPGVIAFSVDSTLASPEQTLRVYLVNHDASHSVTVPSVIIGGVDASDFLITNSQHPVSSAFSLSANDSVWYDITFKPDVTKPYPARFAMRNGSIGAAFQIEGGGNTVDSSFGILSGSFSGSSSVGSDSKSPASVITAFTDGVHLFVRGSFESPVEVSCQLFDLLGRCVFDSGTARADVMSNGFVLNLERPLFRGVYLLLVRNGSRYLSTMLVDDH